MADKYTPNTEIDQILLENGATIQALTANDVTPSQFPKMHRQTAALKHFVDWNKKNRPE